MRDCNLQIFLEEWAAEYGPKLLEDAELADEGVDALALVVLHCRDQ